MFWSLRTHIWKKSDSGFPKVENTLKFYMASLIISMKPKKNFLNKMNQPRKTKLLSIFDIENIRELLSSFSSHEIWILPRSYKYQRRGIKTNVSVVMDGFPEWIGWVEFRNCLVDSQFRKSSQSTPYSKARHISGALSDCPLECHIQLIGPGSMRKGAMINWWCLLQVGDKGRDHMHHMLALPA